MTHSRQRSTHLPHVPLAPLLEEWGTAQTMKSLLRARRRPRWFFTKTKSGWGRWLCLRRRLTVRVQVLPRGGGSVREGR